MNSYQKEALVGFFVLVAAAAFIAGALWLNGKSVGRKDLYVVYSDISTLKDASSVRISGATVGRVDGIEYVTQGKVVVGIKFSKHDRDRVRLTRNATASITAVGMLGDMMIELDPGTGAPISRGDTIRGVVTPGVFDKAVALTDKAAETLTRVNAMLDTNLIVELRGTLQSTRRLMTYLADTTRGPVSQVTPTLRTLQATGARLDTTLAAIDARGLQARLDSTMRSAGSAADRLAALSARADSLIALVEHGNGTVGKFLADSTFYQNLTATMRSMNALLQDLAKNPGKIGVTVKVF